MSLFDFDENPHNIAVIVIVSAAVLFFLCFYCSFIHPVLKCVQGMLGCLCGACLITNTGLYSSVVSNEV